MPLFETSAGAARTPGVHVVQVASAKFIDGIPQGRGGIAAQFDWGPMGKVFVPSNAADLTNTFFPAGSSRTTTGWLALVNRKKGIWTVARVLGGAAGIPAPEPPTITLQGAAGSTLYKYVIVAKNAAGATQGSAFGQITTGNANLGSGNGNIITWAAIPGATSYDIYRTFTAGTPATVGKIGNTASATFTDSAIAGDTTTPPTANTTGYNQAVCYLYDNATATNANSTASVPVIKLVGKYPGPMPNTSMTAVVANDTGGDATKFDCTVSLTDPNGVTGTTAEPYRSNKSTATVSLPTATAIGNGYLLASFALVGTPAVRPANGTYSFVGGSNGAAIASTDYDTAFTLLDTQDDILVYVVDDCGDTIRAATNAVIATHVATKTDRFGIIQCNQSDSWTTIKGTSGNGVGVQRDRRLMYTAWVNVFDINGNEAISPWGTFMAAAMCNLQPQESVAWWDTTATDYYNPGAVSSLVATQFNPQDETIRGDATDLGIALPIKLSDGRYATLHGRTTSLLINERFNTTQRIARFWAKSLQVGLSPQTNGPNNAPQRRLTKAQVTDFMRREATAGRVAIADETQPSYPFGAPIFSVDVVTGNTLQGISAGQFVVGLSAQNPSDMEKIIILLNSGTAVQPQLT